jgi:hypothetical protein
MVGARKGLGCVIVRYNQVGKEKTVKSYGLPPLSC